MPKILTLILLIIIAALFLPDLIYRWSWEFWWYDILLHLLGGVFVGLLLISYFPRAKLSSFLGALLLIGFLWEGFEILLDIYLLAKNLPAIYMWDGLIDTVADLVFDIIGGLALWFGYYAFYRERR